MTDMQKKTVGVAVTSLVLGILGFILLGPFGSIPAVICGHVALSRIKQNPETLTGGGMALAGLIMGYVQIGIMVLMIPLLVAIAIPSFMRARTTSQRNACVNNLRQIEAAKDQYALENRLTNLAFIAKSNEEAIRVLVNPAGGYIKQFPQCPASPDYSEGPSAERAAADYTVHAVGTPAECKRVPATHQLAGW